MESLRPGRTEIVEFSGESLGVERWREDIETGLESRARFADGAPFWLSRDNWNYLAGWPQGELLGRIIAALAAEVGIPLTLTSPDIRLRRLGDLRLAFNYGPEPGSLAGIAPDNADYVLGRPDLPPAGVAAWRD